MIYLPTCTSRLVVQHPCQVSFKSMQGCRRSWEDKLKCVKILSVKDHNSAKICRTWIISPHALLNLWYNICTKFHSNPCKYVGGVEKTNFDATEGRNDGRTEWRTKQTLNAPLPFYGGGIKIFSNIRNYFLIFEIYYLILENDFLILENTDFCPQWLAISFVSFRFDLFRFVLFRFVSICFVLFRSVSFRFDLFRFVSICFVSFRFVSHFTGTQNI